MISRRTLLAGAAAAAAASLSGESTLTAALQVNRITSGRGVKVA